MFPSWPSLSTDIYIITCTVGSWADMSKAKMMGQAQKITRVESPRCLEMGKTGKRAALSG